MRWFSEAEKQAAIDLYFKERLTTQETVDRLGYPTRQNLERWLRKDPRYGQSCRHQVYAVETNVKAAELYLSGQYTASQVARIFQVGTVTSVMNWVKRVQHSGYDGLIPRRRSAAMPKPMSSTATSRLNTPTKNG